MTINVKEYLDYPGLQKYDEEIKAWFKAKQNISINEVQEQINDLAELVGDQNVAELVSQAIADIIDGAPETFDTLKELSDWIEEHGEAAAALIQTVSDQGQAILDLDKKIEDTYDAFKPISETSIHALFLEPIAYNGGDLTAAIAALDEGEKLVINVESYPTISSDFSISDDCVIEAEGVEFTGTVTVAEGVEATVIGATFSGEVKVQ